MIPIEYTSIAVAAVAAAGAWASQRAASKASTVSSRMDAEKEAYERARKLDIETITRLETENAKQREEIAQYRREVSELRGKVDLCNENLQRLQDRFPISVQGLEGLLNERNKEHGAD